MHQSPRLIRDGTGRHKLKVSLPGGRYQLSLDDRAVNLLQDDLGYVVGDAVPRPFVPFFVAFGDAWFPREKDTSAIIRDLSGGKQLDTPEREALVRYATEARIPRTNKQYAVEVLEQSPIASTVSTDELKIKDLPSPPAGIFDESSDETETTTKTHQTAHTRPESEQADLEDSKDTAARPEDLLEKLQQLPGVGPHRAEAILQSGITSLAELADARPVELGSISGLSENTAAVAIEGAREVVGDVPPAPQRLSEQTGKRTETFESALSVLAAAGIPATEAEDTLRVLYGPRVTAVDAVNKRQAYFLWEAGYRTPKDLIDASVDELQEVYGVGEKTAAEIQSSAAQLLQ